MYKKAWCTCKVVVLLTLTYCFLTALVAEKKMISTLKCSEKVPQLPPLP